MRIPRIHVDHELVPGQTVLLPEQAGEHVARVLRLDQGHPLVLFNGNGWEYDARLAALAKRHVTAEVLGSREVSREAGLPLVLIQGIARGEKMDWILQKATELGVARIVPVVTERTEVRLDEDRAERRVAHWRSVVASACEQCGRTRLPDIDMPAKLPNWLAAHHAVPGLRLALLPDGELAPRALSGLEAGALVAVGPEGGFSDHDETALRQAGFGGLRLGPRILRTETAGVAALAALQVLAGDFV